MKRLTWNGSIEAQRQADEAFAKMRKEHEPRKDVCKYVDYQKYIHSRAWSNRKKKWLKKTPFCEVCGSSRRLQVHHKHYRTLGKEKREDVRILCKGCHENLHEGKVRGVMDPMTREYLALQI